MADIIELLASAVFGAIITLIVRKVFAWKFAELERRKKSLEKLLEKVYGPIHVLTTEINQKLEQFGHERYSVEWNGFLETKRISSLFDYEFDNPEYRELLDFFILEANKSFDLGEEQLSTTDPDRINKFIRTTDTMHKTFSERLKELHNMRNGFRNNLKFIFLTWRF